MMRSGSAIHLLASGLSLSETLCKKRRGLPWPIARKTNLISLRSAAFFTIFVCNFVHAYKFHSSLKTVQ